MIVARFAVLLPSGLTRPRRTQAGPIVGWPPVKCKSGSAGRRLHGGTAAKSLIKDRTPRARSNGSEDVTPTPPVFLVARLSSRASSVRPPSS